MPNSLPEDEGALTLDRLKSLLSYNEVSGEFSWIKVTSNRVKVGAVAGCQDALGYIVIRIDGKLYRGHRLAWLYCYGEWPEHEIDHINQDKSDNRPSNLRSATKKQNAENVGVRANNRSGHTGVSWSTAAMKWKAQIRHNQKTIHLGVFTDVIKAARAYETARDMLFTHHKAVA